MNERAIQERINNYLENCGVGDTNFIVSVQRKLVDRHYNYFCPYCNNVICNDNNKEKCNFCSQCGSLLDWSDVYGM